MLVLQNTPERDLRLGGVTLQLEELPLGAGKYELILALNEMPDGSLQGALEYATDLWTAESMERLTAHWRTLLGSIAEQAGRPLSALNMLSAGERERLLAEWSGSEPIIVPGNLAARFAEQAAETPDAIALVFEERQLSYRALDRRSNQLAHYLQSMGGGRKREWHCRSSAAWT
jgi:non-ribosomal peptide synthetase component F